MFSEKTRAEPCMPKDLHCLDVFEVPGLVRGPEFGICVESKESRKGRGIEYSQTVGLAGYAKVNN
jgi:hypothetical protein